MTPNPLDAIQARADAATGLGEWETTRSNDVVIYDPNGFGAYRTIAHADTQDDAEFIAHAREDVPKLVAALRTVENLAAHWETLAPGDQYYARMVRSAIREALGG